jgi:hypothetical protein
MSADYWHSTQYANLLKTSKDQFASICEPISDESDTHVMKDPIVYIINSIDALADQLPRFVRQSLLQYTAIVLAQRYLMMAPRTGPTLDGETCCFIASYILDISNLKIIRVVLLMYNIIQFLK